MALLDIDGTLLTTWKIATQKTKQVIKRLMDNGIVVCLCTGRNISSTLPILRSFGITSPCMCIDGIIMYDPPRKRIIYETKLPNGIMREILDIVRTRNVNVEVVTKRHYFWYIHDKNIGGYDFYSTGGVSAPAMVVAYIYKYMFGVRNIKSLERFYREEEQIYEIVAIGGASETDAIKASLANHENKDIHTRLMWGNQLFITAKGAGKSEGLRILCDHFNIAPAEVVAIGDDDNDIDMLEAAGMGVAMGNAREHVKAAADYITEANDNDGAAKALSDLFLKNR
ncbi:MAG: HAD family hydrolase [Clostridiales bacterium]|jgi:Cof subfamily protein (haloacid dehalogenase superfamily)|nr:HAD family hydrolase [Clostridiales bacterium]